MTEPRRQLLARLSDVSPADDATAFALLWTYVRTVGLSDIENDFNRRGIHPRTLEPMPERNEDGDEYDVPAMRQLLIERFGLIGFDEIVLRSLKRFDRRLAENRGAFEAGKIIGLDGQKYRVRPLNNKIADFFDSLDRQPPEDRDEKAKGTRTVAGARNQSLSLAAYCQNYRLVPAFPIEGLTIDCQSRSIDPSVHGRLREVFKKKRCRFLCWPLRAELRPIENENGGASNGFVHVAVVADAASRHQELTRAVAAAKTESAAVLILPELSMANDDLPVLRNILASHAYGEFPILTIAGIEHRRDEDADVNDAVLLGPYGQVVLQHRKLTRFGPEQITTGTTISVLETPIGNITPLICLDLFNDTVQPVVTASHANVLLVPSLSETTSSHQSAAYDYLGSNLAATLVSNRWFGEPDTGRNQTFSLLPGKDSRGKTLKSYLTGEAEYLVATVE